MSLAYNRLMNHVRYMVARTIHGEKLKMNLNDYMSVKFLRLFMHLRESAMRWRSVWDYRCRILRSVIWQCIWSECWTVRQNKNVYQKNKDIKRRGEIKMKTFEYTIKDELGIHARPAGLLVKEAKKYESECTITKDGKTKKLTQLMMLMSLGVKQGETVTVTAERC